MKYLGNQSHYTCRRNFYEWWYFDFITDRGDFFNLILHETDIFGVKHEPYYSLSCLLDNKKYYLKTERDLVIEKKGKYLATKNKEIVENARFVKVGLTFQEGNTLKIKINKKNPPTPVANGRLYGTKLGFGKWTPAIIGERFNGILKLSGKKHNVRGIAYHDHQWGDLPVYKYVKDWVWGHFHHEETSVVFFIIKSNSNKVILRYYFAIKNGQYESGTSGIRTDILETISKLESVIKKGMRFNLEINGHNLKGSIDPDNLIRSHIDEKIKNKKYSYFRWRCDGLIDNSSCTGVLEYMRFR